jgi:hypothetical protein
VFLFDIHLKKVTLHEHTAARSQLLKIEQKFDTFFVSARYIKNEMSDLNETWYSTKGAKAELRTCGWTMWL